jgi:hypothetical protein
MSAKSPQTAVAEPIPNEELSVDQIMDRFPGEWILMYATRYDEDYWPTHGYVTAHAARQQDMLDEMERQPTGPEHARLRLHSFFADRSANLDDPLEARKFIDEWIQAGRLGRA